MLAAKSCPTSVTKIEPLVTVLEALLLQTTVTFDEVLITRRLGTGRRLGRQAPLLRLLDEISTVHLFLNEAGR